MCWYAYIFSVHRSYKYKKVAAILLCLCVILFGITLGAYCVKNCTVSGIVVEKQPLLFVGPNKEFHTIGSLAAGNHVIVKEQREGWSKVRYSDKIGWIEAEAIQII